MDLGVYITAKNDEVFIGEVIKPVLRVFPQAVAVDLGSTDNTIEEIKKTGARLEVAYVDASTYADMQTELSKRHDWVVWIDSDEIYPISSLERMKELIQIRSQPDSPIKTIRTSWKMIRLTEEGYWESNETKVNGHKAHDSKLYYYYRSWPKHVLNGAPDAKELKEYNGVWCWHAVLLNRSSQQEESPRYKKRLAKTAMYNAEFTWNRIEGLPWT